MARQKPIMRPPSKAPNACPPTLVATTNRRTGSSSISSKPQIRLWQAHGFLEFDRVPKELSDSDHRLRFLPQCLHLVERSFGRGLAAFGQLALHVSEALAELGIGLAQRLFGVHLHETRQVDQHEQQVAEFVLEFLPAAAAPRLGKLAQLLVQLVEHLVGGSPNRSPLGPRAR